MKKIMKMKKIMMTLTAVLCCAMAMTVFTSCSKSEDSGGTPSAPDTTPVSITFIYQLQVTQDMLDNFDMTLEYYDANGTVKSEKVTSKEIESSTLSAKLPAKVAARLNLKEKSDVDYSKVDKIVLGTGLTHAGSLKNKSGSDVGVISAEMSISQITISGSDVAEFVAERGTGYRKFFYEYDASGKKNAGSWD